MDHVIEGDNGWESAVDFFSCWVNFVCYVYILQCAFLGLPDCHQSESC